MPKNKNIILTTLAMNQTIFFVGLAKKLESRGYSINIISFHEDSCSYIEKNGIKVYNIFMYIDNIVISDIYSVFKRYAEFYRIKNPNLTLSHEKVAFNIKKTQNIMKKYCNYFSALEKIFKIIKKDNDSKLIVYQELGGFSSILSTFYFALKNNIDNIFIEPSFFKGRVFFVKNSLKSIDIEYDATCNLQNQLKEYLRKTIDNKKIVIPSKDVRGYNNPINKILSFYNFKRLVQKTYSKIFLKKNEEFSYISNHVKRHIKMILSQILLQKYYKNIPDNKFIYFPMHVPNDVALTIRSPEYLDQLGLIYYLLRNLPLGYKLAIKEHPAMLGDIDRYRIQRLLDMDENIVLLKPNINNFDVLNKADIIVTINSKAGAEAILNHKKVIVLGDAFYDKCPFVLKVDCLNKLSNIINKRMNDKTNIAEKNINIYFQNIWDCSYLGDLYYDDNKNFQQFCESMIRYMSDNK